MDLNKVESLNKTGQNLKKIVSTILVLLKGVIILSMPWRRSAGHGQDKL